jgi:hypothetical protein
VGTGVAGGSRVPPSQGFGETSRSPHQAGWSGVAAAGTGALRASSVAEPMEDRGEIVQICSQLFTSVRIFGKTLHGSASEPTTPSRRDGDTKTPLRIITRSYAWLRL